MIELVAKFLGYLTGALVALVGIYISFLVITVLMLSSMVDRFAGRSRGKRKAKIAPSSDVAWAKAKAQIDGISPQNASDAAWEKQSRREQAEGRVK